MSDVYLKDNHEADDADGVGSKEKHEHATEVEGP